MPTWKGLLNRIAPLATRSHAVHTPAGNWELPAGVSTFLSLRNRVVLETLGKLTDSFLVEDSKTKEDTIALVPAMAELARGY